MRNERGITLFSLVITLIVMLILIGVVVYNAFLEDGGVINEVKNSTQKQQEMIQEEQDKMSDVLKNQEEDWGISK